jgi:lantibiotic transport system permease protein
MVNYMKAELLKQKNSFNQKIIWLIPMVTSIIAFFLMGAGYVQTASYNWWYVLFLPFTFTYISASIIKKEKKFNYHGLFGLVENKKMLWYAKSAAATMYLFITCILFFVITMIDGFIFLEQITIVNNLIASLLLFITFAWQIPFFMLITLKINMFVSILISLVCNLMIASICAIESYWWVPFSIPARLMCPVIKVLPNGLLMEKENPLGNNGVIIPGIIITIVLYIALNIFSAKIFEKQEV